MQGSVQTCASGHTYNLPVLTPGSSLMRPIVCWSCVAGVPAVKVSK